MTHSYRDDFLLWNLCREDEQIQRKTIFFYYFFSINCKI